MSFRTGLLFGLVMMIFHTPGVYSGFACLSNPCAHGVCLDDLNSTYFCYCIDGYTGLQCQTNWNDCWSSPCQNGGVCVDGIASFNCTCPPGFIGDFCEEDFNECESNPCWNNGTCEDGPNGYLCQCLPGYSGIHCEIDIAVCNSTEEARCHNGGICVEGPGDTFSCNCQPGWESFLCDVETNECISAPCQNGAVCIDLHASYECACLFGKNCEETIKVCNKNPCKNGALCLVEDGLSVCYCVPDFHGELCQLQYDECQLGPKCLNGGTCIDGIDNSTCSCPPNLTGVLCECLILSDNQLDCNYILPSTTTVFYTNATTSTTFETEPSTLFSEFLSEETTTERKILATTLVPNVTSKSTETTTIPFCITQTPFTKAPTIFTSISMDLSTTTTALTTESSSSETSSKYLSTEGLSLITDFSSATTEVTKPFTTMSTSESSTENITYSNIYSTTMESNITEAGITEFPVYSTTFEKTTTFNETILTSSATTETSSTAVQLSTTTQSSTANFSIDITVPSTEKWEISSPSSETVYNTFPSTAIDEVTTKKAEEHNRTFPDEFSTSTLFHVATTTFFTDEPTSSFSTESTLKTTAELTTIQSTTGKFESTTLSEADCTLPSQTCNNGGTCIFTGMVHKCLCPFDAEGIYCEIKLGIKNAAFNGNSYITHRLPANRNISIEFETKTLSSNGLIFHVYVDKTYMALYVENGYLMFKFSCGYQTMLLSELKVPVNNGLSINVKANLNFSKDFKHCDALITVNDTLTMTGDQMAKWYKFSRSTAWLNLGGVPNDVIYDNIPNEGFVGCISNLKILNKKVFIYKDAEDAYDISECSSLACLSNPCKNGASCSSHGDSWKCNCKNGFLGAMCEISICDNNPCLFGGTCIPFSNNGYVCLCPYGKHGHFCENDLKITEPYFSSTVRGLSSFVAYPLPEGTSQKMNLKFRFTPTTVEQISLLLFMGQNGEHDFYSDHLAVSFVKGYIMLTWNMGSGPRRIFTSQPIDKEARDYLVQVGYESRRAWLFVENLGNVTGRSPGHSIQLDVIPLLYLGGHESKNFSSLPHDLPLHTGFSGCIFDVEAKIGNVVLPLQGNNAIGRAVGQCGTTECYEKSCQNGGACLHHGSTFMCLCQDKWFGPLCSSKTNFCDSNFTTCSKDSRCVPLLTNYECDCPFGKVGKNCEKEETITDISFTGVRSFLSTHPLEIDGTKFNIEMEIRILKDTGIILFVGKKQTSFICLSIQNGLLELKVHSSKSRSKQKYTMTVRGSKLLLKGVWHKVQFGIFGRKVYLYVDHIINMGVLDHGFVLSFSLQSIYLGGFPDISELPSIAASTPPIPYAGCIRHFSVNENKMLLNSKTILDSRNVIDCDGTPCGSEVCLNGGTCWLDTLMNPHCSCVEPYYGERCEFTPKCSEKNCRNGRCHNMTCSCHIGFEGGFCETELQIKTPAFLGNSYLIVQKLDPKRHIKDLELKELYLNFTTAKNEGFLFWTRKDKSYLGLGLERGFLKLIFSSNEPEKQIVKNIPYCRLSDGMWHNLVLTFTPFSLKLDNKIIQLTDHKADIIKGPHTNGTFFIGGLPNGVDLMEETNGVFQENFEGCLKAFGTDIQKIITDFTPFRGTNIENCKII